jgi:hypothetical protein
MTAGTLRRPRRQRQRLRQERSSDARRRSGARLARGERGLGDYARAGLVRASAERRRRPHSLLKRKLRGRPLRKPLPPSRRRRIAIRTTRAHVWIQTRRTTTARAGAVMARTTRGRSRSWAPTPTTSTETATESPATARRTGCLSRLMNSRLFASAGHVRRNRRPRGTSVHIAVPHSFGGSGDLADAGRSSSRC